MPRIPYVDPDAIADPEIRAYLDRARAEGTPRPESQAIRAHNPAVVSKSIDGHREVLAGTTVALVPGRERRP